jgi:hypothetical protein
MKAIAKFVASATFGAGAMLALSGSALALTTDHGTTCTAYGSTTTAGVYSYVNGTYNYSGGYLGLICPVVRTIPAPSAGYQVWVDGTTASGTSGYCALYSYDYTGAYMGSVSTGTLPAGRFSRILTLPALQVPTWSSQSIYCYLPTSGGISDVEPVQ